MSARSVRRMAPALFGLSLGSTTYVLLNAYKRFFLAAFGDAIWKFVVAGTLVVGVGVLGFGVETLIWGIVAGSVLKLVTHVIGLRDKCSLFRPGIHLANPAMKRMLWLALPLLIGIIFAKIRDNINNVYLLSALDSSGLMQANSMGRKLQSAIHFLVPYSLSIAVFPFFCELVDSKDHAKLGEVVTRSGRMLLAVFIPLCVVIALVAVPMTALLFKGGEFQEQAVARTALSTACYTFVLPAAAIEALAMQAFFANRRMVAVVVIGIIFSAFSMAVSWSGLQMFHDNPMLMLGVIAGGFALSRMLKSITLVVLLRKVAPVFPVAPTLLFLARVGLASVVTGVAAWAVLQATAWLPAGWVQGRIGDLTQLALGGFGGLAGMVAGSLLFGVREPFEMVQWALDKSRGRLKQRLV